MFFNIFKRNKEREYCLVLSGGGVKGFFHIGLIKAIRECDIKIKEISGTSIGALIGAIYAADPNFDIDYIIKDIGLFTIADFIFSRNDNKLIKKIEGKLRRYIKVDNFKDLKIPFSFNAVDINTGEEIIFKNGKLFPSIISSMAIPAALPLIKINNRLLCDGGVVNNLPITLLRDKKSPIIASDLSFGLKEINENSLPTDILMNSYFIMQKQETIDILNIKAKNFGNRDINLFKLKEYFNMLDFRKSTMKKLVDIGYNVSIERLRKLK